MEKEKLLAELTRTELEVIRLLRKLNYGQLNVTVKDGAPVHIEERRSIPLREDK